MSYLVIIRGLPGSGKSTFAKKFVKKGFKHYEADMWMVDKDGNYSFDPSRLSDCHNACKNATEDALKNGENVVVSNTFTREWEMKDYVIMGKKAGATIIIKEMRNNYGSIHDVPEDAMKRMVDRWEPFEHNVELLDEIL